LLKQQPVPNYHPSRYEVERIWATATDGVQVPIALVHKKGVARDGKSPLYLYGYGSYGAALPDFFASDRFSLVDRGVTFAIAHVRGGGEMGKKWHDAGRMMNKKNTFGDFITAAEHLIRQGYTSAELYATTWGPADPFQASLQYHSKEVMVNRIRAFIQAVKAYTGAAKVDVVTHSMGVTLARKAIKGGSAYDSAAGGTYSLGSALTASVDAFVGISGANRGLVACYNSGPTTPTCSDVNGLYPGYFVGVFGPYDVSSILVDMNAASHYEGSFVYTIWSTVDEVIGYGDLVWGQYTSRIPGQNGEVVFGSAPTATSDVRI